MEIERRHLVHTDVNGDVLALATVHSCHQTVQDHGVQGTHNLFLLRVVGNEQVRRTLGVADLQVEVIAVLVKYPVGLLGGQLRGLHTQRTDHTLQLFHRLAIEGRLERCNQREYLRVGLQYLEHGLIVDVQERQDMRHVAVLAQPIGRRDGIASLVEHATRQFPVVCLLVLRIFRHQLVAVLVVGQTLVVHEEIDAGGEEVDCRGLEELVGATATLILTFVQRIDQRLRGLLGSGQRVNVLMLDRVHTARILHIHEVDDVELTARRRLALRLVDAVVIVELLGEGRELVVVNHHRKALGRVLTDERLNDRKCLTRSRRTHHERTTEGVVDIDPAMTELGDVHAVLRIDALLVLLETLVLEVEAVFHQSLLQVLRHVVECHMDAHRTDDGGHHIEPDA